LDRPGRDFRFFAIDSLQIMRTVAYLNAKSPRENLLS
jgi:hypothetical protein